VEVIDVSTPALLKRHKVRGGVCVVGSKAHQLPEDQVKSYRDFFRILEDYEFVGIDIEGGANVDGVADLCDVRFTEKHPELLNRFGWVICGALLEHVKSPFDAARNIQALVKPGGHLFYLGPWVHGFHGYPDDYWRFSYSAIRELFSGLKWKEWFYSCTIKGVGLRVSDPKLERALFQEVRSGGASPIRVADLITDRSMTVLNVGAVGMK